jgi:hypothetical protein
MCKIRFAFFCTERCNGRWNWGAKVTAAIDKIPVACVQACVTCVPLSHVYNKHVLHVYMHALHVYHCRMCATSMCYMCTSMCYMCTTVARVLQACVTCVQACVTCVPLSHVYYKHVLHVYKHVSMCDMCTTHTCATSMCYMCMTITCVQACYMCNKHVWNQVCRYFAQSAVDAVDELPEVADAADIQIITEKCV